MTKNEDPVISVLAIQIHLAVCTTCLGDVEFSKLIIIKSKNWCYVCVIAAWNQAKSHMWLTSSGLARPALFEKVALHSRFYEFYCCTLCC